MLTKFAILKWHSCCVTASTWPLPTAVTCLRTPSGAVCCTSPRWNQSGRTADERLASGVRSPIRFRRSRRPHTPQADELDQGEGGGLIPTLWQRPLVAVEVDSPTYQLSARAKGHMLGLRSNRIILGSSGCFKLWLEDRIQCMKPLIDEPRHMRAFRAIVRRPTQALPKKCSGTVINCGDHF
jgi:hypothetical protein